MVGHGLTFDGLVEKRERKTRFHLDNNRFAVIGRVKGQGDKVRCADFAFDLIAFAFKIGFQRRIEVRLFNFRFSCGFFGDVRLVFDSVVALM